MPFTHTYSSSSMAASTYVNRGNHLYPSTSTPDGSSSRHAGPSRSPSSAASPSSEQDPSSRSRLFPSGRKSPDPFRRFRRLSSSTSLNIAADAVQSIGDKDIPPYPTRPASPAPLDTPRSAPPPLPSSTKPAFQRPKRTKSSSISILTSSLGLRSKDNLNHPSPSGIPLRRRKSASLSGSDADFDPPPRPTTPLSMLRPASPSPSLSESVYSVRNDSAPRDQSKQHKQAWYQAQQKTIELENPHNRSQSDGIDSAKLFPLKVTTTAEAERGSSPEDKRARGMVETFLSEEEMLAAGIHIIRRRDGAGAKDTPTKPVRPYGADHPDFLELIDSPVHSKQTSPLLDQLVVAPASSASMQVHAKSSSGSISASSSGSTDYVPADMGSVHNGSTASLSSVGGKSSFSFAKLRRGGNKPMGVSRPGTANSSSNEDVSGSKGFLFPSRSQSQQQQLSPAPNSLSPGPSSSASPFLNKHSATVGRASGSVSTGHSAKNGLSNVFNGSTVGPSSSSGLTNGVPPPKPPKPKPSLLAAFPRYDKTSRSGSISAPDTAPLMMGYEPVHKGSQDLLQPPASADPIYRHPSHSQEAIAEARLDAEALRASAGTPLPPPRRGLSGAGLSRSAAMARTSSNGASGGVVGALGHVGQFGAAMGRKGWDFMKTLQTNNVGAARSGAYAPSGYRAGAAVVAENEPTRQWLMLLDSPDIPRNGGGGIFSAPLKDVVLRSRLSSISQPTNPDQLSVPNLDLGKDFSSFLHSPSVTPRASLAANTRGEPLTREEARHLMLPRLVVRCIESLEKWGPSEEGIYRISGRSSHTSKLRSFFSDPRNDLKLDEINPADLDINSVCSLLKSYLRELPETLIPPGEGKAFDGALGKMLGEGTEPQSAGGAGGKVSDKAANLTPEQAAELAPLVRKLPVYNWYLLRELTWHLGFLAKPEVVERTKMPLSNLTLVLAPTVSISLPLLQVLVRCREVVFGTAPVEDVVASPAAVVGEGVVKEERKGPPPKPAKPQKLNSPSRLPVMVRKRASSIGLGALLTSPKKEQATVHRRTPSTTPSLELPGILGSSDSSSSTFSPPSPAFDGPYERPSTSLGHFSNSSPSRLRNPPSSRGVNALALPDSPLLSSGGGETPIAKYFARIREESETQDDRSQTPIAVGGGEMHRYWAEKVSLSSPKLGDQEGRSGRTSALDRPRPVASSREGSFFAGRSRRTDSTVGLGSFKPDEGGVQPLRIVKKGRGASVSRSGSGAEVDADKTKLGSEEQKEEQGEERDVARQIRRYLETGPSLSP